MGDLVGRTHLVTGANTGIGRATAHELARRGARVIFACRNQAKTLPVIDNIKNDTGNDAVEFVALDLADLDSVRACATAVLAGDEPIHVLVNNAGIGGQRGETTQGFELAFGVNHLGHFLLTTLLLDRVKESAPARIVNVSSTGHFQARGIDWERVRGPTRSFTGLPEYAVSKLCNVVFTQELARRLEGSGVTTYSLHPGAIASDIWRRMPFPLRQMATMFMRSPEHGARTSIYCTTAPELEGKSGGYYDNCREKEPSRRATPALGAELWDKSEAWVA